MFYNQRILILSTQFYNGNPIESERSEEH